MSVVDAIECLLDKYKHHETKKCLCVKFIYEKCCLVWSWNFRQCFFNFSVLGFYINWAHSELVDDYNSQIDDALKAPNHHQNGDKSHQDKDNNKLEFDLAPQPLGALSDQQELQEAKLRIRELESKLLELDKRIPKKYPNVNFLTLTRKRILVNISAQ